MKTQDQGFCGKLSYAFLLQDVCEISIETTVQKNVVGLRPIDVEGFGSFYLAPRSFFISACGLSEEIALNIEGSEGKQMLREMRLAAKRLISNLEALSFCVSRTDLDTAALFIPRINSCMTWMCKTRLLSCFTDIPPIFDLIDNLLETLLHVERDMLALREKYKKKSQFLRDLLEGRGFEYTTGYDHKNVMSCTAGHSLLVSISDSFDYVDVVENLQFALQMKELEPCKLFIVDQDLGDKKDLQQKSLISHYKDKKCLCNDVKSACTSDNVIESKNPVKSIGEDSVPERALFKVRCPKCKGPPIVWTCMKCSVLIEYCCNGVIVCDCGWSTLGMLSFQCGNYFHESFVPHENLEELHRELRSISPAKQTNILLVGQSGVGKSTWINSFVNFLKNSNFDDAVVGEITTVIPMQFTICDDKGTSHQVRLRGDEYEDLTVGASATQASRSYVLYKGRERITIVDTPGLGDTRGYEQDVANIRGIIHHLKTVPKVHALCFVLLPNETRLNILMRFVIQEIFINLHTSAKNNIFFLFTNARSTNYRPGSSIQLVEQIVKKFRNVQNFSISDSCVYMFDSEAFRFLCALKETPVTFTDEEKKVYKGSWDQTCKEVNRFLNYISKLEPYETSKSFEVHRLRMSLSLLVSKKVDQKSGQSVENLEEAINHHKDTIAAMKESYLEVKKSLKTHPSTSRIVCASVKCHEVHDGHKFYKTTCYTPFAISRAFLQCRSAAPIQSAPIIQNGTCTKCNCIWEEHMVIDFEQSIVNISAVNPKVAAEIDKLTLEIEMWESQIAAQKNKVSHPVLNDEFMSKKLGKFLAQNSILLYNDATDEYLSYLIDSEGVKSDKTQEDFDRIDRLKDIKQKNKEADQVINQFENMLFVACDRTLEKNEVEDRKNLISDELVGRGKSVIIQL